MQVGDHVGALAVLGDAGKAHRGARDEGLRIGNELVEVVVGPGAALPLHGRREIETPAVLAPLVANDPVKVRTDTIGATLLEGVAGTAFLRRCGTLFHGGGLQQLLDRLGGCGRGFLGPAMCLLLYRDFEAWLRRHMRRKKRPGGEARHQQNKAGAENSTENFVELKGVHWRSGSRPEMSSLGRREAAADTSGIGLSHRTPSEDQISVCPCSGNPYKCAGFRPIPHHFRPAINAVHPSRRWPHLALWC